MTESFHGNDFEQTIESCQETARSEKVCCCAANNVLPKMGASELVDGVLAQLVERLVRNEKVRSSSLLGSTSLRSLLRCEHRLGKPVESKG